MHQWWENVTINEFTRRAQCIIDQYSSFVLEDVGLNINGKMTNGENIAGRHLSLFELYVNCFNRVTLSLLIYFYNVDNGGLKAVSIWALDFRAATLDVCINRVH